MNKSKAMSGVLLALALGVVALLIVLATGGGEELRQMFLGARNVDARGAGGTIGAPRITPTPVPTPAPTPTPTPEPEPEVVAKADDATSEPIELALLQAPGAIHGWVENQQGLPVEGAELRLDFENLVKDGKKAPTVKTVSRSAGRFQFEKVPPGSWTVIAEHPGYSVGTVAGVKVVSEIATTDIEVIMQPAVEMEGVVRSVGGQVLSGVSVAIARSVLAVPQADGVIVRREVFYRDIKSDANGKFVLQKVAPGPSIVTASLDGYAPERIEYVVPSDNSGKIEIVLSAAAPIGGIVRNTDGRPLQGATVELSDPQDKGFKAKTETGRKGDFLFKNLRSGRTYRLGANAPNYAPSQPLDVESGRTNLLIVLGAGGSISGKIVRLETQQIVPGLPVVMKHTNAAFPIEKRTASTTDGTYVFRDLPTGEYEVRVESDRLVAEPRLGVKVKIPEETKNVDFVVYEGQKLEGIVLDAATGDRIAGAIVKGESRGVPGLLTDKNSSAPTDDLGIFRFTNLPQGIFEFSASKDGYMRDPGPEGRVTVKLELGTVVEPITLLLHRGGVVSGTVVGPNGVGVPDAAVRLFKAPGGRTNLDFSKLTAITDQGGRFEIGGIAVDKQVDMIAGATKQGLAKGKSDPFMLTEFLPSAEVVVPLGTGAPLTVLVKEGNGLVVADAKVSLGHNEFPGDPAPESWSGETDNTGRIVFANIPEGRGSASASKAGYISGGAGFTIIEGQPAQIEISLEKGTSIKGVVVDDAGVSVSGGTVRAFPEAGGKGGGTGNIGSDGYFEIGGVGREGTYRLVADAKRKTPYGEHTVQRVVTGVPSGGPDVRIVVPFNGSIAGLVFDFETVLPIKGARVRIDGRYDTGGGQAGFRSELSTPESGEFQLPALPPSTYTATVSAEGYLPATVKQLVVVSPSTIYAGKIGLRRGATVKARVISDTTGESVVGAKAVLTPGGRSATTNQNGEFAISAIEPGMYELAVTHARFLPWKNDIVQVRDKNDVQDLGEVRMEAGGTIRGRIVDEDGKGVGSAEVIVRFNETDTRRNATTDANGIVRVEGLEAGGYTVTVTGRFPRGRVTKSTLLTVSRDEVTEFEMILGGHLRLEGRLVGPSGYMTKARLDVYPLEPNGNPVMGGRISATVKGIDYVVADLVEGGYLLAASATVDGEPRFWHRTVQLDPPGAYVDVTVGSAAIGGSVLTGQQRAPVPNATVRLRALTFPQTGVPSLNRWWEWTSRTNDAGTWRVRNLHPGTYEVIVRPPGSAEATPEILTVGPGEDRRVSIVVGEDTSRIGQQQLGD